MADSEVPATTSSYKTLETEDEVQGAISADKPSVLLINTPGAAPSRSSCHWTAKLTRRQAGSA